MHSSEISDLTTLFTACVAQKFLILPHYSLCDPEISDLATLLAV